MWCIHGVQQRRNSTLAIIKRWLEYVDKNRVNDGSVRVSHVLDFLAELFQEDLGYSALNSARSSLSTFLFIDGKPVGTHPLVIRLMKGVFKQRPSLPRHNGIWDVNIVLTLWSRWFPLKNLSIKLLTYKLAMLILLA